MDKGNESTIRALFDEDLTLEEIQRFQTVSHEELSSAVAIIETELKKLFEGEGKVEDFLEASQLIFPMGEWKQFYFLKQELSEELLETGLVFEVVFKNIDVVRCLLPPIAPFISFLCQKYHVHTSLATTKYNLVEPSAGTFSRDPNWTYPDEYLPLDRDRRLALSEGVKVAVIDTGVDIKHKDLMHIPPSRCLDFSGKRSSADDCGHGTHCIGIINGQGLVDARCTGIAPGAQIYSLKALDCQGGTLESILAALDWWVGQEITVFNLSLGSRSVPRLESYDLLSILVETIIRTHDLVICIAAGNEGCGNDLKPRLNSISSPGDCPSAITVGAVDKNSYLSPFSSRGSVKRDSKNFLKPNICAPGENVVSCLTTTSEYYQHFNMSYINLSGTSMSAPFITGVCCLLLGSGLDNTQVVQTLAKACEVPIDHTGQPYSSVFEVGWGVLHMPTLMEEMGWSEVEGYQAASIPSSMVGGGTWPQNQPKYLVPQRCDWSGIPLPSDARLEVDYLQCEDDPTKGISIEAYRKFKGQVAGQKLSKANLHAQYQEKSSQTRNQVQSARVKRNLAIELFKANAKRLGFTAELQVMATKVEIPAPFYEEKKVEFSESLPQIAYYLQTGMDQRRNLFSKRKNQLFALCFEDVSTAILPAADEVYIAIFDPIQNGWMNAMSTIKCRCVLEERTTANNYYWRIKDRENYKSGPDNAMLMDLFWLEREQDRVRRCMEIIQLGLDEGARMSLRHETVDGLIQEFGMEFMVNTQFNGYKIFVQHESLIIRKIL